MANRYRLQWLTVHFPHTSTAILKIDVMKRYFEYRPLTAMFATCFVDLTEAMDEVITMNNEY